MALVTTGGGVASISGSIGGITYARNRGGSYARNRTIPTNPNTSYQQAVRSLVAQLTSLWGNVLTAAQRSAWDSYAEAVLLPNPLGELRNVGGLGMFVRSNVPRLQADPTNLPRVDTGPSVYNLGDYTAPTLADYDPVGQDVEVSFTSTDDWVGEDDAAMLVYLSRPMSKTRNFFKGPYRYAGAILGDGTTAPTSPATISMPFTVLADQKVFAFVRVTRADGRLSSSFRGATTHTT